jgi:hypothetical protein
MIKRSIRLGCQPYIYCSVWSGLVTIFPLLLSVSLTKEHLVSFGIGLGGFGVLKRERLHET